jgi:UDP-N-acetylmuramoyl-L-alanyl-D-glutamate--2,6-diaminopimelate ligase
MERIEAGQTFQVVVDSAHTEDALRNGLRTLRAITPGRLLVVFGCGGRRDRHQRALMAKAVQALADIGIATADNPRTEALAQIFEDMRVGVSEPEKMTWMTDRRRAIGLALAMAKPGDTVLIAGKGDESFQECADTVYPFDDREVARELLGAQGAQRKT